MLNKDPRRLGHRYAFAEHDIEAIPCRDYPKNLFLVCRYHFQLNVG